MDKYEKITLEIIKGEACEVLRGLRTIDNAYKFNDALNRNTREEKEESLWETATVAKELLDEIHKAIRSFEGLLDHVDFKNKKIINNNL